MYSIMYHVVVMIHDVIGGERSSIDPPMQSDVPYFR